MPPQVVVVLELLVADGTDVLHTSWPRHGLHWSRGRCEERQMMEKRKRERKMLTFDALYDPLRHPPGKQIHTQYVAGLNINLWKVN